MKEKVCVTGGGGYLGSWVVNYLLSKGVYIVHATVRDPSDEKKNGYLKKLENAAENLRLFKADLLDYESLCEAIDGCTGVLHVASPVPFQTYANTEAELIEWAVTGTRNVMNACIKSKVKKVVVVSSTASVLGNPNWPNDQLMDETCWSDVEFHKHWYVTSKTLAEREALGYAERNELNVVTVLPSLVIGPMLQPTSNASTLLLLKYMKGGSEEAVKDDHMSACVDVRDVAEAILLAYEKPEAEGRYICMAHDVSTSVLVEKLKSMFPAHNYPKKFVEVQHSPRLISQKLQSLGWKYRPLEESIADSVKDFHDMGLLD